MAPLHPLLSVRGRQGSLTSRASLVLATDLEEPLPETPPRRTKSQQAMLNSTRLRYLPAWRVVSLYLFLGFAVLTLLGLASMHAWHPKRQGSQPDNTSYGLLHQAALDEALTQMDVLGECASTSTASGANNAYKTVDTDGFTAPHCLLDAVPIIRAGSEAQLREPAGNNQPQQVPTPPRHPRGDHLRGRQV